MDKKEKKEKKDELEKETFRPFVLVKTIIVCH